MKLIHIAVFWLLIFFILSTAAAQQSYFIQHFTTENGLPANGIVGFELDKTTGFLWIASESGIIRFNGHDLKMFNNETVSFPIAERITCIFKNFKGEICIVDEKGNILKVKKNNLIYKGFTSLDIRTSGNKLIGLWASDSLFAQSSLRPPKNIGIGNLVQNFIPLSDSSLLYTANDYVYRYTTGNNELFKLKTLQANARIFKSHNKVFVYNTDHQFYYLNEYYPSKNSIPEIGDYKKENSANPLPEFFFWQPGNEYPILISGKNAWKINYEKNKFLYTLICNEIPVNSRINAAQYWDEKKILIISTASKGIFIIKKKTVIPVKSHIEDINHNNAFYSQVVTGPNSVITHNGERLTTEKPARVSNKFNASFNNYTYKDGDSILWFQRSDSIFKFNLNINKQDFVLKESGAVLNGFIRNGNNLFFTNIIGMGLIQNDQLHYMYQYPKPANNNNIPVTISNLSPSEVAIATCNGLLRFNLNTAKLDTLLSIPNICIRALFSYKDYLFIGTYGKGIFVMKNNVIKSLSIDKNRYLLYTHCFMKDAYGFCWMSTNKGLFKALFSDLINAYETGNQQVYYHYFGKQDGMEITELNGGCYPCAVQLPNGQISFPSMDGLVWANPALPVVNLPGGKIFIDGTAIDGKNIQPDSTGGVKVPGGTRELLISLAYPAWGNTENIDIQYQLSIQPDKWISVEPSNNGKIRINQLSSGTYELRIRQLTGFGIDNYTKTTLLLSVQAPWYLRWWFILLSLLSLTGLILAIVRISEKQFKVREQKLERQVSYKTAELNKQNEELEKRDSIKTRLISIISHDIVTPLRFLHIAGKNLKENKKEMSVALQAETIDEITSTSKELELLTTNILNWIKYHDENSRLSKERVDLHEMSLQVFRSLHALAKHKKIVFLNYILPGTNIYQYTDPLKIVVYNLVLNAINFMEKGQISISSQVTQGGIKLKVKDEGVGMTPEQINNIMNNQFIIPSANVDQRKGNGLGYIIIKDLLKIMGATLQIQSEKSAGTTVIIEIPDENIL